MDVEYAKKQYRTVGITVFVVAVALLIMRIVSYYVQVATMDVAMDEAWFELLLDAVFTVPVQIGILLIFPFLMYKLSLKKSARSVLEFSGYRKCSIWTCLLCIPLGLLIVGVSLCLSFIWQIVLILFGYTPSSGGTTLPEQFNAVYFILSVVLTAVLPAICEEFTNRGGLLTVMRSSFSKKKTIFLIAIAFGLFHQFIGQVFYTAVFGALLAYLVLETQSIYPAMIVHFMNNFVSVLLDNATTYNWAIGGGFYEFLDNNLVNGLGVLTSWLALILLGVFGLLLAITSISRKKRQKDFYLEMNTSYKAAGYKVELKDNIFFIGAIVVCAVSTLLTYIFGL